MRARSSKRPSRGSAANRSPSAVCATSKRPGRAVRSRSASTRPEGAHEPRPLFVFYHGGGWVCGSRDSYDAVCRLLTRESGCALASVDYRLAPEHPAPQPFEDCYAATAWLAAHGAELGVDPSRLAVGGDSAGGGLAANVALKARDARIDQH